VWLKPNRFTVASSVGWLIVASGKSWITVRRHHLVVFQAFNQGVCDEWGWRLDALLCVWPHFSCGYELERMQLPFGDPRNTRAFARNGHAISLAPGDRPQGEKQVRVATVLFNRINAQSMKAEKGSGELRRLYGSAHALFRQNKLSLKVRTWKFVSLLKLAKRSFEVN